MTAATDGESETGERTRRSGVAVRMFHSFGWGLFVIGLGLLASLAYQLWGTGLVESSSQAELRAEFEGQLAEHQVIAGHADDRPQSRVTTPPIAVSGSTSDPVADGAAEPNPDLIVPDSLLDFAEGDVIGRLTIPALGVDQFIVEGVSEASLREGPGHYPTTSPPGLAGNAAIAGHRTTYGAPFNRIGELQPGDAIHVEMVFGTFTYEVVGHGDDRTSGSFLVPPDDVSVLRDGGDHRLTLTSCHPMYSDRERIIVTAQLVGEPAVLAA